VGLFKSECVYCKLFQATRLVTWICSNWCRLCKTWNRANIFQSLLEVLSGTEISTLW